MENQLNNDWRLLAAAVYRKPRDSKIYGSVTFDVTDVEAFVKAKRREGLKITLTHIFLLAFARGIREAAPEFNTYVRRGSILPRAGVDVSLTVITGQQLTSVKVVGADRLTLPELSHYLQEEIPRARKQHDAPAGRAKNLIARMPWPLRQWIVDLVRWLSIDLGIPLPFLGVSPESFGTFVLSNLGSIGIDVGYAALAPFSNVALVITQGRVSTQPAVVNGQIVPRRMITCSAVIDHRVADAAHAGRLFAHVRGVLRAVEGLAG